MGYYPKQQLPFVARFIGANGYFGQVLGTAPRISALDERTSGGQHWINLLPVISSNGSVGKFP